MCSSVFFFFSFVYHIPTPAIIKIHFRRSTSSPNGKIIRKRLGGDGVYRVEPTLVIIIVGRKNYNADAAERRETMGLDFYDYRNYHLSHIRG